MNIIPFFRKPSISLSQTEIDRNQKQAEEAGSRARARIVQLAIELNHLLNPGSVITVSIEAGKILTPGQINGSGTGIIIISRPANMETLHCKMNGQPEPGNGGEPKP